MLTTVDIGIPNGCTEHIVAIADGFAARGHPTILIAPRPTLDHDRCERSPIRATFLAAPTLRSRHIPRAAHVVALLPLLLRSILRGDGDIVYVRTNSLTVLLVAVARLLGRSTVVSEHNGWIAAELHSLDRPRAWISLAGRTQVLEARLADHNRTVTPQLAQLLIGQGVPKDRVFTAGNGTDLSRLRPAGRDAALRRRALPVDARYVGFVGNLAPWQGVSLAIRAVEVLRAHQFDVHLLVIGDGPERLTLEGETAARGLGEVIHFVGYVEASDLRSAMACIDVAVAPFVHARNAEVGLSPLKLRDYAAMGLPVVAPALPGIDEPENGSWLSPHAVDDHRSLAWSVAELLQDDAKRRSMAEAARRHAETHFGWERVVDVILKRIAAQSHSERMIGRDRHA